MQVVRGRQSNRRSERPTEHFQGMALQDYVFDRAEIRVQNVFFEPKARTDVHAHPDGQLLVLIAGSGIVGTRGARGVSVRAGDMVFSPPGEFHWHGASARSWATFLAVSIGRKPIWPE